MCHSTIARLTRCAYTLFDVEVILSVEAQKFVNHTGACTATKLLSKQIWLLEYGFVRCQQNEYCIHDASSTLYADFGGLSHLNESFLASNSV